VNALIVQNLRHKLQKRVGRFNSVDESDTFYSKLAQFWRFFDHQPTFVGIVQALLAQFPNIDEDVDRIFDGKFVWGKTEEQAAAIGYSVLHRLVYQEYGVLPHQLKVSVATELHRPSLVQGILELFLEPFCNYVDEQLDDQRVMLALLKRYKHRSEWFHRERLWELSEKQDKSAKRNEVERRLAVDLYSYLYDQGIDFHIEPSSMPGAIDLIAAQGTNDPLLLDVKVFDNKNRNKYYLRKGFNQIYTYALKYNEPFGYLVIYKITDRDLCFSLKQSDYVPVIIHNHKTIFLLTIDVFPHAKPPSQQGSLKPVVITEGDLVEIEEQVLA
jgi:hypothetical protein